MPRLLIRSHSDPSQLPVAKYGDSRHRAAPEGRVGSGDIAGHFGAQVVKDGRLPIQLPNYRPIFGPARKMDWTTPIR